MPAPALDSLPSEINRALAAVSAKDSFRDDRPLLARLFGSPRFAWEVGWLTVNGQRAAYAQIRGWPPDLIKEAHAYLGARFVIDRTEYGLLDKRRHHPFAIVVISSWKAAPHL